jgi:DNA replication protein DnaC
MHDGTLLAGGKWFAQACKTCLDKERDFESRSREAQEKRREQAQESLRWSSVGFSEIHHRMLLKPAPEESVLKGIADGAFLYGPSGPGKTFLAVHAVSHMMKAYPRFTGRFIVTAELILSLRRGAKTGADAALLDDLSAPDMLVVDDIGTERITDYAAESLYLLVDRWHRNCKKGLIVTSNLTPFELSSKIGDKIVSRIIEMCPPRKIDGPDRRLV